MLTQCAIKKYLPLLSCLALAKKKMFFLPRSFTSARLAPLSKKKQFLDTLVMLQAPEKTLIQPASYEFYKKWYYPVVRELVAVYPLGDDFKRIARLVSPRITPGEARQAIALLVKLGFIRKNASGHYEQVKQAVTTGETWRSVAVRQFQLDTFDLAKKALNDVAPKERDISTLTMSISEERYRIIKERITAFRNELVSLITSDKNPERVYEMNIAFFPLSEKEAQQ